MKAVRVVGGMAVVAFALGLAAFAGAADEPTYVGAGKCKMCHSKIHKSWETSKHAKAMSALRGEPKAQEAMAVALEINIKGSADKTDECVQCHVTGFKKPGGYPQADSTKNATVAMVGCESCHGPGSAHVTAAKAEKKATIKRPTEETCKGCHTDKTSPDFDFDARKSKVHPVAAAAPAK